MLEPVGGKSGWAWHNSDNLRCPTRSDPFIGTYLNSQDDFELDEEVKYMGEKVYITRYIGVQILIRFVSNLIHFCHTTGFR